MIEQLLDFYSHAREGRDGNLSDCDEPLGDFYSHAREGRDEVPVKRGRPLKVFLLTRPRGA